MDVSAHASPPKPRRRWLRPTFGLSSLFLLTAVVAGGMAWWRLPFEVEEVYGSHIVMPLCSMPNPQAGWREVRTVRRIFLGDPIRHGPTILYDLDGKKVNEETWCNGVLHGPCVTSDPFQCGAGVATMRGQYDKGQKHGKWIGRDDDGNTAALEEYDHGTPVGTFIYYRDGEKREVVEHRDGKVVRTTLFEQEDWTGYGIQVIENDPEGSGETLTRWTADRESLLEQFRYDDDGRHGLGQAWYRDGSPRYEAQWVAGRPAGTWRVWDRSRRVVQTLEFTSEPWEADSVWRGNAAGSFRGDLTAAEGKIATALLGLADLEYIEVPLKEVLEFLADEHEVPIILDRRSLAEAGLDGPFTVTANERETLALSLTNILAPHGLAWTIRYDHLWITTQADAASWRDETGVYALRPSRKSALAAALDEPTEIEFIETPLRDVVEYLKDKHKLHFTDKHEREVDAFDLPDSLAEQSVTICLDDISLRSALGILLHESRLTCVEKNDVLLVRPAMESSSVGP